MGFFLSYPVEVLIPAPAFEHCCRKASMKTESGILPGKEKLPPSIPLCSVLMCSFSHYFTVLHIVAMHLSPGDHCRNPGLYLLPAGEWTLVLGDSNKGERAALYHPISPARIWLGCLGHRSGCGSPTHSPPYTKDLGLFTGFDKVAVITPGRLLSPAAQLLPVVHFVPCFSADPCRRQFLRLCRSRDSPNSLQGIVQAAEITLVPLSVFRTQERFLLHLAKVMNGAAGRSFQVNKFLRALLKQPS